jgi:hypothetical protein
MYIHQGIILLNMLALIEIIGLGREPVTSSF